MSVAERTRAAVHREPYLYDALRAGVVNYSAAARALPVEGDEESVATALRRFAEELDAAAEPERRASVRLHRGVGLASSAEEPLLAVGDAAVVDGGDLAAVHATGDVDPAALETVLGLFRAAELDVLAAAVAESDLLVAVARRSGPEALRLVEDALE